MMERTAMKAGACCSFFEVPLESSAGSLEAIGSGEVTWSCLIDLQVFHASLEPARKLARDSFVTIVLLGWKS